MVRGLTNVYVRAVGFGLGGIGAPGGERERDTHGGRVGTVRSAERTWKGKIR